MLHTKEDKKNISLSEIYPFLKDPGIQNNYLK